MVRSSNAATPATADLVVVPWSEPEVVADSGEMTIEIGTVDEVTMSFASSSTATSIEGPAGSNAAAVMTSSTSVFAGCVRKARWHAPVTGVAKSLPAAGLRSLPGDPLKLLACFTTAVQIPVDAEQEPVTDRPTVTVPPGARPMLRPSTRLPFSEAVPWLIDVTDRTWKPAGAVRVKDPSCCWPG